MRKVMAVAVSVVLSFVLVGCGEKPPAKPTTTTPPAKAVDKAADAAKAVDKAVDKAVYTAKAVDKAVEPAK